MLHRAEKNGLGRAYIAGFKWALERGYEFVFEMDGDFSHNPDDVPAFLEAAQSADLVLGSRYIHGIRIINWPLHRLMLSKGAARTSASSPACPSPIRPAATSVFAGAPCWRWTWMPSNPTVTAFKSNSPTNSGVGATRWPRPIIFTERVQGHSKMSGHIVREALVMVWRLWFQNGCRRRPRATPVEPAFAPARRTDVGPGV